MATSSFDKEFIITKEDTILKIIHAMENAETIIPESEEDRQAREQANNRLIEMLISKSNIDKSI